MGFDLHGRPPFVPVPLLDLVDWPPCPLELDLHQSESSLPKYFCADVVSTSYYVMNKVLIRPILKKTLYELFNGRKPNISHLRVFGYNCFVLNNGK